MAVFNKNGQAISYPCADLIREAKRDIAEFGGEERVIVWTRESEGVKIYTNYDFPVEESPISFSELKNGEMLEEMTLAELLPLLEKQNSIL